MQKTWCRRGRRLQRSGLAEAALRMVQRDMRAEVIFASDQLSLTAD
jgi:hypothetical protein